MSKKYAFILFFLLIIAGNCFAVQVDGYCALGGVSYHAGSKVLFIADSPTAVTDSVYTDAIGYYQIEVEPGLYDVNFSHDGYSSQELIDQLLMNPTTLTLIVLQPSPSIPLSGSIRGVIIDTIYTIVGHTQVDMEDSLIIEPGATILFSGNYLFSIHGYLYAVGTEQDSIIFSSIEGTSPNCGVKFWGPSDDSSIMRYWSISGSVFGGIVFNSSQPTVENCLIYGNYGSNGGGIATGSDVRPIVRNCVIRDNSSSNAGGIHVNDNGIPLIENCIIIENHTDDGAGGVRSKADSSPTFKNCIIANNGPQGGVLAIEYSHIEIDNCTIYGNWAYAGGYGITCGDNATITVRNSIIQGNTGYGVAFLGASSGEITHCDFYDNEYGAVSGTGAPAFFGQLNFTNFNGDPCDLYQNIFLDPLFTAPHSWDLTLTAESPCIDAGDPLSRPDPDSTIADQGAYYFDQSLTVPVVTISVSGDNIVLIWEELPFASTYNIYRSNTPYFSISGMTLIASVDLPTFTDSGAVLEGSYFYVVTGEE